MPMPFFEQGDVRIRYEEAGSGFPVLLLAPGGLNSAIEAWGRMAVFNPLEVFKDDFRLIAMDQRNANGGESTGPIQVENPWDAFLSDQLGLLDHLGIGQTFVLGFCIGCSYGLGLMEKAPERIAAGVLAQPIGHRPEDPNVMVDSSLNWGRALVERRPDVGMAAVEKMVENMYRSPADFVYSVSRDFVRSCQTPMLVLPGIDRAHPYDVGMEVARLAPNSDPWKEPAEIVPETVEVIRDYLKRHAPSAVRP